MARSASKVAQDFADHLNMVLNGTVTHGRLTLYDGSRLTSEFFVQSRNNALALNGCGLWLWINQRVQIEGEKTHTMSYSYRLCTEDDRRAWIVRWQYVRERETVDPLVWSNLHIRATLLRHKPPKLLKDMHLATGRVPLELVLWHLITDWGVHPVEDDWRKRLGDSMDEFFKRRTHS
jgi:hypothetical protein